MVMTTTPIYSFSRRLTSEQLKCVCYNHIYWTNSHQRQYRQIITNLTTIKGVAIEKQITTDGNCTHRQRSF